MADRTDRGFFPKTKINLRAPCVVPIPIVSGRRCLRHRTRRHVDDESLERPRRCVYPWCQAGDEQSLKRGDFASPFAGYGVVEGALASGFAYAGLHHPWRRDALPSRRFAQRRRVEAAGCAGLRAVGRDVAGPAGAVGLAAAQRAHCCDEDHDQLALLTHGRSWHSPFPYTNRRTDSS